MVIASRVGPHRIARPLALRHLRQRERGAQSRAPQRQHACSPRLLFRARMSEDRPSLFMYGEAADELRRQELERLKAATIPTLGALRALQPEELHTEVAGMLERLGYTHEATTQAGDIILTKDDRKFVVAVARRSDIEPIQARPIARLHSAIILTNAAAGFFVTSRQFEPSAVAYVAGLPITLVDGDKLLASMQKSKADAKPPDEYKAMCKICGCVVKQHLSRAESVPCGSGHFVVPTIARAAIFAERAKPAENSGNKSAHAPRAKHGRRMTVKKFNKALRMKHARGRSPKPKG